MEYNRKEYSDSRYTKLNEQKKFRFYNDEVVMYSNGDTNKWEFFDKEISDEIINCKDTITLSINGEQHIFDKTTQIDTISGMSRPIKIVQCREKVKKHIDFDEELQNQYIILKEKYDELENSRNYSLIERTIKSLLVPIYTHNEYNDTWSKIEERWSDTINILMVLYENTHNYNYLVCTGNIKLRYNDTDCCIDLKKMYCSGEKTNFGAIRCYNDKVVMRLNFEKKKWELLDKEISDEIINCKNTIDLSIANITYRFDKTNLTQTNTENGSYNQIKIVCVK